MRVYGKELSERELIEIWDKIQYGEWDDRIGSIPEGFKDLSYHDRARKLRPEVMVLELLTSHYARLKYQLVESNPLMTEEEFDITYRMNYLAPIRAGRRNIN